MFVLANYCDFMAKLSSRNTKRDLLQVTFEKEPEERGEQRESRILLART